MSSNDAKFIHEDNRAVVQGQSGEFAHRQETLGNLARLVGITWPWGETQSRTKIPVGCAAIVILIGLAYAIVIPIGFGDILTDPALVLKRIPAIMMFAGVGIALVFGLGDHLLTQAFLAQLHLEYAIYLLHELETRGQVIAGEVVSVQVTGEGNQQIEYRLAPPKYQEAGTNFYITATRTKFAPGDLVAVLYLTPSIHILL